MTDESNTDTNYPVDALTPNEQLKKCRSHIPFYIDVTCGIWRQGINAVQYIFVFCVEGVINKRKYTTEHRYSKLREFYNYLCEKYTTDMQTIDVSFPSKVWFWNTSEWVVRSRLYTFRNLFSKLTLIPNLICDHEFLNMFAGDNADQLRSTFHMINE